MTDPLPLVLSQHRNLVQIRKLQWLELAVLINGCDSSCAPDLGITLSVRGQKIALNGVAPKQTLRIGGLSRSSTPKALHKLGKTHKTFSGSRNTFTSIEELITGSR